MVSHRQMDPAVQRTYVVHADTEDQTEQHWCWDNLRLVHYSFVALGVQAF